ncbi:MAG TPA: TolC family protein [Labilithrix sp.]|nr:TolC family protein [Labilithrix sp.]
MSSIVRPRGLVVGLTFVAVALVATSNAGADDQLSTSVDRVAVLQAAVSAHPGIRASEQRAQATSAGAASAGSLPPPEVMVQVWQVPIARPYALGDAGMVMVGLGQTFPSPGARSARERAGEQLATAERAMAVDRARAIRRDAEHAFVDYVEASARHSVHASHRSIGQRALALARARHAGGGSLTDVTQAEVELARVDADVIGERTRVFGARARLNALLVRDLSAPLGPPVSGEPEIAAWDLATEVAKARDARPQLRAAEAEQQARAEESHAAAREATIPSFSVAALYFAPVGPMPVHGYGANASMSLPWLWGEASSRRDAARGQADAARSEVRAAAVSVNGEVAMADANMRASALRLQALRDRALPATRRSFDAAWAGYEAGRTDVLTLLVAQRAVVDVESEIIVARASLDHALAELDASVGVAVPRRPLGPLDAAALEDGGDHGR